MSADATFQCGGCSKAYKWKPELAGKKVRCKCGQVIDVPAAAAAEDADMYDLAPDPEPPKPTRAPRIVASPVAGAVPAAAAVPAMPAMPAAPVLPYQRPGAVGSPPTRRQAREDLLNQIGSPVKDLYVPIALILAGTIITYASYMVQQDLSFAAASIWMFGSTLVSLTLIFLGLLAAVKWLDISLGPIGTASLKIVAVAIFPNSLSLIFENTTSGLLGFAGWAASLLAIYFLLGFFFEMDSREVLITCGIIWAIRRVVGTFLFLAVFTWIMGGGSIPTMGGGGGGPAAVNVQANDSAADGDAGKYTADPATSPEARTFVTKSNSALAGLDNKSTKKIVEGLYANKAKSVKAADVTKEEDENLASYLVVELPDDAGQKKDLLKWIGSKMGKLAEDVDLSVRQGAKFLIIEVE